MTKADAGTSLLEQGRLYRTDDRLTDSPAARRRLGEAAGRGPSRSSHPAAAARPVGAGVRPMLTTVLIVAADAAALGMAATLGAWWSWQWGGADGAGLVGIESMALLLSMAGFAASGLYPAVGMSPRRQRRVMWQVVSLVFGAFVLTGPLRQGAWVGDDVRGLLATWAACLALAPAVRCVVRAVLAWRSWWGQPVVVIGGGPGGRAMVRTLQRQPGLGLRPVAILADLSDVRPPGVIRGVPVLGDIDEAPRLARQCGVRCAVLLSSRIPPARRAGLVARLRPVFADLVLVADAD